MQINQLIVNLLGHPMNSNKKMLGGEAIAVVAAIMIAASTVSMVIYTKKRDIVRATFNPLPLPTSVVQRVRRVLTHSQRTV